MSDELEMVLLKMKDPGPLCIARYYVGVHLEGELDDDLILVEKVCALYEQLTQEEDPKVKGRIIQKVKNSYQTESAFSNGGIWFRTSEVEFIRKVDLEDELLNGYHDSFKAFEESKSSLILGNAPTTLRPRPNDRRMT